MSYLLDFIGAIIIITTSIYLIHRIKSRDTDTVNVNEPQVLYGKFKAKLFYIACFLLGISFFSIANYFINPIPTLIKESSISTPTTPDQVEVSINTTPIYAKEGTTIPFSLNVTNKGNSSIEQISIDGSELTREITSKNTSTLSLNLPIPSYGLNKVNISLSYISQGKLFSKEIQTPIHPVPNIAIKELNYKYRNWLNFYEEKFEPGEYVIVKLIILNKGISKVPANSIRIEGRLRDLDVGNNCSKIIEIALNPEGEYKLELVLKINDNPPLGKTAIDVNLIYNDPIKGEIPLDSKSITIKIIKE
jgi:hypothetical protein